MHKHRIAHLDISLRNLLTDYRGHYAYIDYELSRRFDPSQTALVYNYRGTELPPECEGGGEIDPYKVDVWALAVLMLRACKVSNSVFAVFANANKQSLYTAGRVLGTRTYACHRAYAE
jgi:serine/threonine protein kinase